MGCSPLHQLRAAASMRERGLHGVIRLAADHRQGEMLENLTWSQLPWDHIEVDDRDLISDAIPKSALPAAVFT